MFTLPNDSLIVGFFYILFEAYLLTLSGLLRENFVGVINDNKEILFLSVLSFIE